MARIQSRANLPTLSLGMYTGIATVEISMEVSKKSKNITSGTAIPNLGMYLKKTLSWKDTCMPMFIAALFTINNLWKYTKCSLVDKWIKNGYTHDGILHSHKKEYKFCHLHQHGWTWKFIMPSEISQKWNLISKSN